MKKIIVFVLCFVLVLSLSIFAFSSYSNCYVSASSSDDFKFFVGTTGGGQWYTSADHCLLATLIYLSADGFPSMENIMRLENQVYNSLGDYSKAWFAENGYKVLDYKATPIPMSIIRSVNNELLEVGSSIQISTSVVAILQLPSFDQLNLIKGQNMPILLDQGQYDGTLVSPGDNAILESLGTFDTYFQKTNDFFTRLDISIFSEIQKSLNTMYKDSHYIQQQVLNPIKVTKPFGSEILEEVDKAEDALISDAQSSIYRGRDFMAVGLDLLRNYGGEFAFVVALFEAFYDIAVIKTLCIIGFAFGFFAFCINLVGDGASSLRSVYRSAKQSRSSKKEE